MSKPRRQSNAEFKLDTVLEAMRGEKSIAQICRERDIKDSLLYKWREQFEQRAAAVFGDGDTDQRCQAYGGERYEAYVDGFAASGYLVLRPDLRGHGGSEGTANGAYGHPDYTIDVLNAVAAVKQFGDADPDLIGMWGHRMGGYLVLRTMVVAPDINAGVIWSGMVASYEDLLQLWTLGDEMGLIPESVRVWGRGLLAAFGTPQANPQFWSSISANSYVVDLSGPIQLHHGSGDTVVPLAFSNLLEEDIVAAGGTVGYFACPGDDHNLTASFETAMARSIAFFDTHVKNAP